LFDAGADDAGAGADAGVGGAGGDDAWIQPPPDINDEHEEHEEHEDEQYDDDDNDAAAAVMPENVVLDGRRTGDSIDIENSTLLNRYMYQDIEWYWSFYRGSRETDPNYDDAVYELPDDEIRGLRENRGIAITLFARMRFRETLFHNAIQFLGQVWPGSWVPKYEWIDIMHHQRYLDSIHSVMYEFVIRRGSAISPIHEANIFGFIKDVAIQDSVGYDDDDDEEALGNDERGGGDGDGDDSRWENTVEYVFVAEVFTPTDFYVHGGWSHPNQYRSYGGYSMTDGTITTQQLTISFSQIRRMYRMNGRERAEA